MKKMPYQIKLHGKRSDTGFSLIEVLVCIAIVALISVPIMAGFRASALYTNRAHSTQVVTAYAQETLETVKSVDVDTFKAQILAFTDADGNANGSVDESDVDTALQAQFDSYPAELFKRIVCRQNNIEIGGDRYNMEVVYDPVDYSQKKDPTLDAFSNTPADDANVYAVNEVGAVNGMLFPVIADEISKYEGTGSSAAAVLYNLQGQLKKNQLIEADSEESRIATIYQNLTKKVKVTISDNGAETTTTLGGTNYVKNVIKVTCDLTYESTYNGVALKQIYNVFSGNYELLGRLSGPGMVEEWEKGGNIYIFARAYQDQFLLNAPSANIIEIENNYSGSGKLDIYLVRGYYFDKASETAEATNKRGLQFDQVIVNGTTYSSMPQATVLSGELSDGNTYFHTNIKGMFANRQLQTSDFEATIGMAKPSLRCYKVTIQMYERDDAGNDGDEVANIETTKEIR